MRSSMRESFIRPGRSQDRESFSMRNFDRASFGRASSFSRGSSPSIYFNDTMSLHSDRPEDMSYSDLTHSLSILSKTVLYISLENDIYKRYLERTQPDLLANVEQTVAAMTAKENRFKNVANMVVRTSGLHSSMSLATLSLSARGSMMSFATSAKDTYASPSIRSNEKTPSEQTTMSMAHKQEMAVREMEEINREMDIFRKRSVFILGRHKARKEQLLLSKHDVVMASEQFVEQIQVNGVEAITQKIPAEKFVRFMTETLKYVDTEIGSLRLKTNMLRQVNVHVHQQLILKRELNESLCPVDFAQLKIDNETQSKEMTSMNEHLIELKEMAALFKIRVSKFKAELMTLVQKLEKLTEMKRGMKERIKKYEVKIEAIKLEIDRERNKLEKLQERRREFTVPDSLDYLKIKMKIFDLNLEIKTGKRKSNVQHANLVNTTRKLKTIQVLMDKRKAIFSQEETQSSSFA